MAIIGDAIMVFGPVYGYYAQYTKIKGEKTVGNFSVDVCAILIFANILRILFWFGERFEIALVLQSILMIATQVVLLMECVKVSQKPRVKSQDGTWTEPTFWLKFWRWNELRAYIESIVSVTGIFTVFTILFVSNNAAMQFIGLCSATIEAGLGLPQLLKNYKSQNASGISFGLIGSWFLGDFGKTLYFLYTGAPMQFLMCGIIQLTVDILIILQIKFYKNPRSDQI